MLAEVINISSLRRSAAADATNPAPALSPAPRGRDAGSGTPDSRAWLPDDVPNTVSVPSPTEIEAARYYVTGYYTAEHFVRVCGSLARCLAAWNAYDHQKVQR